MHSCRRAYRFFRPCLPLQQEFGGLFLGTKYLGEFLIQQHCRHKQAWLRSAIQNGIQRSKIPPSGTPIKKIMERPSSAVSSGSPEPEPLRSSSSSSTSLGTIHILRKHFFFINRNIFTNFLIIFLCLLNKTQTTSRKFRQNVMLKNKAFCFDEKRLSN